MCSPEKVQEIVDAAEKRGEAKLEKSHMAIAQVISEFGNDLKEVRKASTDAVIDRNSIHDKLESLGQTTTATLKQAKENNHRTSKLETWRSFITGGLAVLTIVVVPVLITVVVKTL